MRSPRLFLCPLCALLPLALPAQRPAVSASATRAVPATAAADYKDEGFVVEHYDTTVRMQADGTGERVEHMVVRVQSEGAVRNLGVVAVSFAAANSSATIEHTTVRKPDGTTVTTPEADAMEVTSPVTREAPMYSDLKQLQLPVRSLAAGDVLSYDLHTRFTRAEAPGQFWGAERILPFGGVMLSRTLTLQVPASKYVQVWSPRHMAEKSEANGVLTYHWQTSQLERTKHADQADSDADDADDKQPKDPDEDSEGRKLPSIAWTTFHSWAEVGDWYRGLALSRAEVTPALRERAEALTKDAKTPEEQARALYNFVAARIRYVGIDLGSGRFQPHAAGDVLSNQYGDCKDKDTLLEALLRARGLSVSPALVGAGVTPVPQVPSPAVFNHVITTVNLPAGRIWLDSTAEVAPYQYLVPQIRDQEALVVPEHGDATLIKTPAAPPYQFTSRFEATGELGADAVMKAKVQATYRDDEEIVLRELARNVAPAEWDKASQYVSYQTGFSGTTSNTRFAAANDLNKPMELSYDYTRKKYGDNDSHQIVALFPAVTVVGNADAKHVPDHDIDLGVPRTDVAISRIRIPQGWGVDLPDAVHEKSPWVQFDKTYHFVDGEIVAERTVTVLQAKVPRAEWQKYQAFSKKADLGNEHFMTLLRSHDATEHAAVTTSGHDDKGNLTATIRLSGDDKAVPDAPADASPEELLRSAIGQMQAGQYTAARATLERVRKVKPEQPGLHALFGGLDEQNNQLDDAISEYTAELKSHPEMPQLVQGIVRVQMRQGKSLEARETLQRAFGARPDDTGLGEMLAAQQMQAEQYTAAAGTWQKLAESHPDDTTVKVGLGNALFAAGRREEAAAAAKSALDGSTDPGVLNDAGYLLAETGSDLPAAEAASRKSLESLDEKSRALSLDAVNSTSYQQSYLLIASWDTLGWILFAEGKLAEAEPFLAASWHNALHPEVGEHLGRLLEQRGDRAAAVAQYRAAEAAIEGDNASALVRKKLVEDLQRLGQTAVPATRHTATPEKMKHEIEHSAVLTAQQKSQILSGLRDRELGSDQARKELQDMRTFQVQRPTGVKGWGTVRLLLSAQGVQAVQQASGDGSLKALLPELKTLRLAALVPAASKALLLKSAVLSCSQPSKCELVLVPQGSLQTEQQ